jgi:hypothetical protein
VQRLDDRPHQVEADADAGRRAGHLVAGAVEAVEDPLALLARQARTGVVDVQVHQVALGVHGDADSFLGTRVVLDRVVEQVVEHDREGVHVERHGQRLGCVGDLEDRAALLQARAGAPQVSLHHGVEVGGGQHGRSVRVLQPRAREHLVARALEAVELGLHLAQVRDRALGGGGAQLKRLDQQPQRADGRHELVGDRGEEVLLAALELPLHPQAAGDEPEHPQDHQREERSLEGEHALRGARRRLDGALRLGVDRQAPVTGGAQVGVALEERDQRGGVGREQLVRGGDVAGPGRSTLRSGRLQRPLLEHHPPGDLREHEGDDHEERDAGGGARAPAVQDLGPAVHPVQPPSAASIAW